MARYPSQLTDFSNSDDIIDSRDIIARIQDLEDIDEPDEDEVEELQVLRDLAEEASSSPDWQYGESLIRNSYFKEYAQELAEDIGAITHSETWPLNCIDWEQAARELKYDYSPLMYDGIEYWIRS